VKYAGQNEQRLKIPLKPLFLEVPISQIMNGPEIWVNLIS
jgi:hypothetical protein